MKKTAIALLAVLSLSGCMTRAPWSATGWEPADPADVPASLETRTVCTPFSGCTRYYREAAE